MIEKAAAPGDAMRAAQEDHDSVIGLTRELVNSREPKELVVNGSNKSGSKPNH